MKLDDVKTIELYDKSGMLELIESFPEQIRRAKMIGMAFEVPRKLKGEYENIVCTGLGGSAIGLDLVRSYVSGEAKTPFFVNRNYTLPRFVNRNSLVIVSSYSGDTEETISAYKDAKSKKANIVVITSGGKLALEAGSDGFASLAIPGGLPPRCSLGYSFFPLLMLLSKLGFINDKSKDINDTIENLEKMRSAKTGFKVPQKKNPAKIIARDICGKFPVIYACQDHMDSVATRWRGQLAENSKTLASSHVFPELSHNEVVGWENPDRLLRDLFVIMLKDVDDHPRNSRRMDIVKHIIEGQNVKVVEVASTGKGLLSRMFSLIYMGDYVSFYLAILNRTDPTPVARIKYLKEKLAKG